MTKAKKAASPNRWNWQTAYLNFYLTRLVRIIEVVNQLWHSNWEFTRQNKAPLVFLFRLSSLSVCLSLSLAHTLSPPPSLIDHLKHFRALRTLTSSPNSNTLVLFQAHLSISGSLSLLSLSLSLILTNAHTHTHTFFFSLVLLLSHRLWKTSEVSLQFFSAHYSSDETWRRTMKRPLLCRLGVRVCVCVCKWVCVWERMYVGVI